MKIRKRVVNLLFVITILLVTGFVEACVNHDLEGGIDVPCRGFEVVSFANDVKPIIATNCAIPDCHNGDNGSSLDWTVFSNFSRSKFEAKRRLTLPPSDPDKMPRTGELNFEQIQLIVCWVEQGGANN